MYTLISLFYISFLGIILMIVLKRRELSTGKRSLVSRLGAGSDRFFNIIFTTFKKTFEAMNKRTFVAMAHFLAYHVLLRVRKIYVEIKHRALLNPHGKKIIDAVRGRGTISTSGASFYLRRISSDR